MTNNEIRTEAIKRIRRTVRDGPGDEIYESYVAELVVEMVRELRNDDGD